MIISVSRTVAADPAVVWDLLVDTERWADWGPSVTRVDTAQRRIGPHSTGRITGPLGRSASFEVTHFDHGRSWSWTVAGISATTHTVEPVRGGCRVCFGVPVLAAPYVLVCRVALGRIERLAVAR